MSGVKRYNKNPLLIIIMLCLIILYWPYISAAEDQRLVQGVRLGFYTAGGLCFAEVQELLDKESVRLKAEKFTLCWGSNEEQGKELSLGQLGVEYDVERIWREAYNIGRTGSRWRRWYERWQVKRKGAEIPLYLRLNTANTIQLLEQETAHLKRPALDARFIFTSKDKVKISPSVPGRRPDLDKLIYDLGNKIVNKKVPQPKIGLEYLIIEPKTTFRELKGYRITGILSSFKTSYNMQKTARMNNIKLAVKSIEGFILPPGEIFSFNQVVGPRTRERGYEEADVILNNKLVPDLGGGVCQVSSTLYNAVLQAELEILERHPHSLLIRYVEPGLDAAVVYGSKDFSFCNNSDGHLLLKSTAENGQVVFKIYGLVDNKRKVMLKSYKEKEVPPRTVYINDPEVPRGQFILEKEGSAGFYIRVEKHIYDSKGQLLSREIISRDYYPPVDRVIRTSTDILPHTVLSP